MAKKNADPKTLGSPRSIRFTEDEWKGAVDCAAKDFGGANPSYVVRVALREYLKRRRYI